MGMQRANDSAPSRRRVRAYHAFLLGALMALVALSPAILPYGGRFVTRGDLIEQQRVTRPHAVARKRGLVLFRPVHRRSSLRFSLFDPIVRSRGAAVKRDCGAGEKHV